MTTTFDFKVFFPSILQSNKLFKKKKRHLGKIYFTSFSPEKLTRTFLNEEVKSSSDVKMIKLQTLSLRHFRLNPTSNYDAYHVLSLK